MLQDGAFAWQTGSSPAPKAQGDCARRLGPHKRTVLRLRQGFRTNLGLRRAAQRWKFVGKDASIDCSLTFQACVAKYLAHPAVRIRQRAAVALPGSLPLSEDPLPPRCIHFRFPTFPGRFSVPPPPGFRLARYPGFQRCWEVPPPTLRAFPG